SQVQSLGAVERLLAMGLAVGAVVLIPAMGMGMTFPLLTELVAPGHAAGGGDVGRAYAVNTAGSIVGAVLTGFVLVVTLGTDLTLRLGLLVNVVAALALASLAARGIAEGSVEHRRLRVRVLGAGALASLALVVAFAAPRWSTRLIDLGPSIYARGRMDAHAVTEFLAHRGSRQLAYAEGWNATISVWEGVTGRALKVNGKADASDYGDMDTQIIAGLAPVAARPAPRAAFVVGYGSGVTARVLADVPGMQLYHLPLPVVAGIVRNVRAVFPHVQLWFGAPGDVMVLGSPRPLRYDGAWLSRLVGPRGALGVLGREYLGVDQPEDYFGHF